MALTTWGELQKQLTVIFGVQDQFTQKAGEIVGIGELSRKNINNLINHVLNYLYAFNSMLAEYSGCKLHSIEFTLKSTDIQKNVKLLPKSMLYIPGDYKNVNTLLLLLAPEMSLLDTNKSKNSVNEIGKLVHEIGEAINRKELSELQKKEILNIFAHRFALKLQGEVIEGKWERKLIGIKKGEKLDAYLSINLDKIFNWQTKKMILRKYQYRDLEFSHYDNEKQQNFQLYKIHPKIITEIIKNSFELTSNLLQIANTGSINDTQHHILTLFLNIFKLYLQSKEDKSTIREFKNYLESFLPKLENYFKFFKTICEEFSTSAISGSLEEMLTKFNEYIPTQLEDPFQVDFLNKMSMITEYHLHNHEYIFDFPDKIRSNEFKTPFLYINQTASLIIKSLRISLPKYFQHFLMESLLVTLMESIQKELSKRDESIIKILGIKSIHQLSEYYQISLEKFCNLNHETNPEKIIQDFKQIINGEIEEFRQNLTFRIEEILEYCREKLPSIPLFENTIEKLMFFRTRIENFWNLTLHQSTKKRVLENIIELDIYDPKSVSSALLTFLQKKFGGIQTSWKNRFFDFINEFGKNYQSVFIKAMENKEKWDILRTPNLLFKYLEDRIQTETSIEGFLVPLKEYLNSLAMKNVENRRLLDIYEMYKKGIEINDQFPEYFNQILNQCLEFIELKDTKYPITFYLKSLPSVESIISNEPQTPTFQSFSISSYYDFLVNSELKYFSKLIAQPSQIILESLNHQNFRKTPLKYIIQFEEIGDKYLKTTVLTNYKKASSNF